jgi:signal transduction histidine kinase
MNIEDAKEFNELTPEYLSENLKDANKQISFMSQTIDDFRSFYAPSKTKEPFLLSDVVNETVELINNVLTERGIELTVTIEDEKKVVNYKNEYKQVLLNLLTNAKDILHERNIPSPQITIEIKKSLLTFSDNGGGVDTRISEHLFEA